MTYAVEMGSRAEVYVPSLIHSGSGITKLTGGDLQTREHGERVSPLQESRLENGSVNFPMRVCPSVCLSRM
jgi:hypothetical protein